MEVISRFMYRKSEYFLIKKRTKDQFISIKQKIIPKNMSLSENVGGKTKDSLSANNKPGNAFNSDYNNSNQTSINSNNKSNGNLSQSQSHKNTSSKLNQPTQFNSTIYIMKSSNSLIYDFKKTKDFNKNSNGNGITNTVFNENNFRIGGNVGINNFSSIGSNGIGKLNLEEEKSNANIININSNSITNNKLGDSGTQNKMVCKCKKSNCLKLYCACIANEQFCTNCNCVCCKNVPENENRNEALKQIKQKNPKAFKNKNSNDSESVTGVNQSESRIVIEINKNHMEISCKCSNSGCIQRYCECYKNGIRCSSKCNCKDCKNIKSAKYETINIKTEKADNDYSQSLSKLAYSAKEHLDINQREYDLKVKSLNFNKVNKDTNINSINTNKFLSYQLPLPEYKNMQTKQYSFGQYGVNKLNNQNVKSDKVEQDKMQEYETKVNGLINAKKLVFENFNGNRQTGNNEKNENFTFNLNHEQSKNATRALRGKNFINYQETSQDNTKTDEFTFEENEKKRQNNKNIDKDIYQTTAKFILSSNGSGSENEAQAVTLKQKRKREKKVFKIKEDKEDKVTKEQTLLNSAKHTNRADFRTPITTPDLNPRYSEQTAFTTGGTMGNTKKIMVPKDFSNVKKNLDYNFNNI